MKKSIIYNCSICNEQFDNEEACKNHEACHNKCSCENVQYIEIFWRRTGYGQSESAYINFSEKAIEAYMPICCDQEKKFSFPIKHCPLCGKDL